MRRAPLLEGPRSRMVPSLLPRRSVKRILLSTLMIARGGPDDRRDDPPGTAAGDTPLAPPHTAPERAGNAGLAAGNLAVEAVLGASILNGGTRLVTSGTL